MQTDAAALAAERVPGLVLRPYAGEADVPDFVRIFNAEEAADGLDERLTVEGERAWLSSPDEHFDPRRDMVLAELDGRMVGAAWQVWIDNRDGVLRDHRLSGVVDPEFRGRGIGSALLAHNERRARERSASLPADRRGVYGAWSAVDRPASKLLQRSGYEVVRWFFDMVRPTLDDLPEAALPDGLELRPVTPDQHLAIWRANREAFRDHWGGSDESEDAMRRYFEAPERDLTLWLIAWDGDEVAGGVFNEIPAAANAELGLQRGWLESVFTRRAWRRRGLARALMLRSLALLRERGMTSAALGVDADNPLGALGLYESAGFAAHERYNAWRKPMHMGNPT
jgi:mycothiol synthase